MKTACVCVAITATFTLLAADPKRLNKEGGRTPGQGTSAHALAIQSGTERSEPSNPPPLPPPPANSPKPPRLIRETRAFIPTDVLRRVSGVVELKLRIGKDGKVRQVEVLRGSKELADPLADAARNYLYEPTRIKGRLVEVTTTIVFHIMTPPL